MGIQPLIQEITPTSEIIEQKPSLYDWRDIDLTIEKNNEQVGISGDFLYVFDAPASLNATIRFNEPNVDGIPLKKGMRIQLQFYRFFLTTNAVANNLLRLAIGKDLHFTLEQLGLINVDAIGQPVKSQAANNWNLPDSSINVDATVGGKLVVPANAARQSVTVVLEQAIDVAFGKTGLLFAGGAGAGRIIVPGSAGIKSYTFYHNQAIWGICQAAQSCFVSYEEEYNT